MDKRLSLLSPHQTCLGARSPGDAWSPAVGSRGLWSAATREGGGEKMARPHGCEWSTTSPGDVRQGVRETHS